MIFKRIALIPNKNKDTDFFHTKRIIDYFKNRNTDIYIDIIYYEIFSSFSNIIFINKNGLYDTADLIIILGGDGTILREASVTAKNRIPIIGLNLGRIGFMSEIEIGEIELLDNIYNDNFYIENRMMIDVTVEKNNDKSNDKSYYSTTALNDAVITNGIISKMIEIELSCDGTRITNYRADGVIIATPTGSTAYSLSAGGPIIAPTLECFCVTPICPHTLINRPLIFSSDSILEIKNINIREREVYLTIDGSENIKLDFNDTVKIKRSNYYLKLISVKTTSFYDIIRNKISEKF